MSDISEECLTRESDPFLVETPTKAPPAPHWRVSKVHAWLWAFQILLFGTSLLSLFFAQWLSGQKPVSCVKKHSVYSPALEVVDEDYSLWRFNGTFRKSSPYKGPPSAEVDRAWSRISDAGVISVSEEVVQRIGASTDSIKIPERSGGGYMASLEVFHQLHCLNLLWQGTYVEHYQNWSLPFQDSPRMLRLHIDHCADLLRQKLQCDSDVGIITYNWVKGHTRPWPNFNTIHKCRNYDDIRQWTLNRRIRAQNTPDGQVERPADAVDMDLPP